MKYLCAAIFRSTIAHLLIRTFSAMSMTLISTPRLLLTCMEANAKGCTVIYDYFKKGKNVSGTGMLKEEGNLKSVVTEADIDAQKQIVGHLQSIWGTSLRIIGEEDEQDASLLLPTDNNNIPIHFDPTLHVPSLLPLEEITIFVDPLDGTREFVEGRLKNVACLIGIAWKGTSIGGVVGIPFANNNQEIRLHYALLTNNDSTHSPSSHPSIWKSGSCQPSNIPQEENSLFSTNISEDTMIPDAAEDDGSTSQVTLWVGDSGNDLLVKATQHAFDISKTMTPSSFGSPRIRQRGGTASKMMTVSQTPYSMAILHFKTCLWDTCATEALVHARGGKVTDLYGRPLIHSPQSKVGNIYGVVVSSGEPIMSEIHDRLCLDSHKL